MELKTDTLSIIDGLGPDILHDVRSKMQRRSFAAGGYLCCQGDMGESLFLIESGLVEIWLDSPLGRTLARRARKNEVLGEGSLLSGDPRSATLIAAVPTTILELERQAFADLIQRHPEILHHLALMLIERQKMGDDSLRSRQARCEAIALVVGDGYWNVAETVLRTASTASVHPNGVIDVTGLLSIDTLLPGEQTAATALDLVDRALANYRTVITVTGTDETDLPLLLRHMDRVVIIANSQQIESLETSIPEGTQPELFLIGKLVQGQVLDRLPMRIIRSVHAKPQNPDIEWLGRHLSHTKLGIAFGAGGAKCLAHIGALRILEEAGYIADYVAGSSIGAIVAACVAMGMNSDRTDSVIRRILTPEICGPYFRLVPDENNEGATIFWNALIELFHGVNFSDLPIPLAVMCADLNTRLAIPLTEGPVAEALRATLTIPGLAEPYERGTQRLVDGVTISPVPIQAVRDLGADITLSVNLLSRDELDQWPSDFGAPPPAKRTSTPIDVMLETLMMLQIDTSVRQAAEADITVTPLFAPASWRDISLLSFFERAGRAAAKKSLPDLRCLCSSHNPAKHS